MAATGTTDPVTRDLPTGVTGALEKPHRMLRTGAARGARPADGPTGRPAPLSLRMRTATAPTGRALLCVDDGRTLSVGHRGHTSALAVTSVTSVCRRHQAAVTGAHSGERQAVPGYGARQTGSLCPRMR